ncbi:MAG: hypothetical protein Q7S00_08180 [bacterium]|nr:hypothetical protein [bacterium]
MGNPLQIKRDSARQVSFEHLPYASHPSHQEDLEINQAGIAGWLGLTAAAAAGGIFILLFRNKLPASFRLSRLKKISVNEGSAIWPKRILGEGLQAETRGAKEYLILDPCRFRGENVPPSGKVLKWFQVELRSSRSITLPSGRVVEPPKGTMPVLITRGVGATYKQFSLNRSGLSRTLEEVKTDLQVSKNNLPKKMPDKPGQRWLDAYEQLNNQIAELESIRDALQWIEKAWF